MAQFPHPNKQIMPAALEVAEGRRAIPAFQLLLFRCLSLHHEHEAVGVLKQLQESTEPITKSMGSGDLPPTTGLHQLIWGELSNHK